MSQQWEYRSSWVAAKSDQKVNAELARWAAQGWELVNGTHAPSSMGDGYLWFFWRRAV